MEFLHLLTHFGAAEESSGIGALGIDFWAILAQAATFLVLFFVIKKFALDGIVKTLDKRRKTIDDGVRLGREMEAEKAALDEKVENLLRKARVEADGIIAGSQKESSAIIKAAEEAANRKAEAILADAHGKINEDIAAARKGLEQEMRALVAEATEVIIEEKLDAKKDESLLKRAFARVGGKA
jgi:F-type H+-transporting ATPase subunit b